MAATSFSRRIFRKSLSLLKKSGGFDFSKAASKEWSRETTSAVQRLFLYTVVGQNLFFLFYSCQIPVGVVQGLHIDFTTICGMKGECATIG